MDFIDDFKKSVESLRDFAYLLVQWSKCRINDWEVFYVKMGIEKSSQGSLT